MKEIELEIYIDKCFVGCEQNVYTNNLSRSERLSCEHRKNTQIVVFDYICCLLRDPSIIQPNNPAILSEYTNTKKAKNKQKCECAEVEPRKDDTIIFPCSFWFSRLNLLSINMVYCWYNLIVRTRVLIFVCSLHRPFSFSLFLPSSARFICRLMFITCRMHVVRTTHKIGRQTQELADEHKNCARQNSHWTCILHTILIFSVLRIWWTTEK